jgi:ABC-type polysaccharide/polyol phosphate export permease
MAGPFSLLLMYASAVFYTPNMIPETLWGLLKYNPLLHIVNQARATLLWHQSIDWIWYSYSLGFGICVLALGILSFKKLKPAFADVL